MLFSLLLRAFLFFIAALGGLALRTALAQPADGDMAPTAFEAPVSQTLAFINGRVFDGEAFVERPLYVENGRFVAGRSAEIDSTIDVAGDYVVPPFGDAHNHHTVDPWIYEKASDDFMSEGDLLQPDAHEPEDGCGAHPRLFSGPRDGRHVYSVRRHHESARPSVPGV